MIMNVYLVRLHARETPLACAIPLAHALAHAHYFQHTKWLTVVSRTEGVDALSLQRSTFRENPSIKLILVTLVVSFVD